MLKTIPVVEIFGKGKPALQGEGLYSGCPSIFLRVFGCNLRCSFGLNNDQMAKDSYINQIKKYTKDFPNKTLEELPTFGCFCDSYYAILPEYRKFSKEMSVDDIIEKIIPFQFNGIHKEHLVITGGEPLLPQYQLFYIKLLSELEKMGLRNVTFETNTTYNLEQEFIHFISETLININFSMSPKIKSSGQERNKAWKPYIAEEYIQNAPGWFKFVVKNEEDVYEVMEYLNYVNADYSDYTPVYLMPEGGTKEEFDKYQKIVYNLSCEYGFRYSPRLHITAAGGGIGV